MQVWKENLDYTGLFKYKSSIPKAGYNKAMRGNRLYITIRRGMNINGKTIEQFSTT